MFFYDLLTQTEADSHSFCFCGEEIEEQAEEEGPLFRETAYQEISQPLCCFLEWVPIRMYRQVRKNVVK